MDDGGEISLYVRSMSFSKRAARAEAEQWAKARNADLCDVFMLFERQGAVWRVSFTKPLGAGQLPRVLTFADPAKIRSLFERFGTKRLLEDRAAFEFALERGRGVVMLSLGREQYSKLLRK